MTTNEPHTSDSAPGGNSEDRKIDLAISNILRIGVTASSIITLTGAAIYFVHNLNDTPHYQHFHPQPESLTTVQGILTLALQGNGEGIMQTGVALLLFTPIIRVAFSIVAFFKQRDWIYVLVSAIVFFVLMLSLFGGKLTAG